MPIVSLKEFLSRPLDYLIVGGGTAGLCLAARLSEDRDTIVGVLEAGEYNPNVPVIDVPSFLGGAVANPTYDWTFYSEDQSHLNGRKMRLPQGKGLGGSSQINFLGIVRPSKEEYDAIEELGNKGWNWHSLLEVTKRSEHTVPSERTPKQAQELAIGPDPALHGQNGPIIKSFSTSQSPVYGKLFDALEHLHVSRNPEPGGGFAVGSTFVYNNVDPRIATRSYAATGYYEPNVERPNFLVLTGASATKVIFDSVDLREGKRRATGVEFIKDGSRLWAAVKKDVILSAGTPPNSRSLQSPKLLELSGIGNTTILEKHGIETLVELPGVGENLQDHVMAFTVAEIDASLETVDVLHDAAEAQRHAELYKEQKGLLSTLQAPAYIFIPASKLGDAQAWRDAANVQCTAYLASINNPQLRAGLARQYAIQQRWFCDENHAQGEVSFYNGHFPVPTQPKPGKRYMTLNASILHPFSRGSVHIQSSDPSEPPAIDPQYFSNSVDLEILTHTVKLALKLYETEPLTELVVPDGLVFPTKDDLEAMMPRDLGGVVDNTLRVYGTDNLRVVDMSVFPMELASHTQSSAYAVGEMAADIIKRVTYYNPASMMVLADSYRGKAMPNGP
ncbi:alcohol oxidase, partial [Armillaria solidipes]